MKLAVKRLSIPLIIYLACNPAVQLRDRERLGVIETGDDGYIVRETCEFDMYQKKRVSQRLDLKVPVEMAKNETVQIWSQVRNFSLGEDCSVQYHLSNLNQQAFAFPFSWAKTPNLTTVVDLVESNFQALFDQKNLQFVKTSKDFPHLKQETDRLGDHRPDIGVNVVPGTDMDTIADVSTTTSPEIETYIARVNVGSNYIQFPHDLRPEYLSEDLSNFYDKMRRRVQRVYDRRYYQRWFRYESKPQQITRDLINCLFKYCDQLVIITPRPEKIKFTDLTDPLKRVPNLTILNDLYYSQHSSWKRENLVEIIRGACSHEYVTCVCATTDLISQS